MASINYVVQKLAAAGLQVEVDGDFILVEDPDRGFERSHDGVKGVSDFCRDTLEEYEQALLELFQENLDTAEAFHEGDDEFPTPEEAAELPQEEPMNYVSALIRWLSCGPAPTPEEFAPAPPIKEHAPVSDQLDLARVYNSPKETAQALKNDDQDRGGIPNPGGYEMAQNPVVDTHDAVAVILTVGQRFMAPKGYQIKEVRPSGQVLFYGSILKGRKLNNGLKGSQFFLTPRS